MNNTKKMVLVPYQSGRGEDDVFHDQTNTDAPPAPSLSAPVQPQAKRGNSIRKYAADRQQKLLQIVLKLASYGGYDNECRIVTASGDKVEIVPLLLHASSPGRNITGISDFIDLLYNAGVQPDLIINAGVRDELRSRMKNSIRPQAVAKRKQRIADLQAPVSSTKRQRTDEDGTDVPLPGDKRIDWENDSEEEDDPLKNGKKFA